MIKAGVTLGSVQRAKSHSEREMVRQDHISKLGILEMKMITMDFWQYNITTITSIPVR